jgi:uncharacterized membrane protein YeaQ/YmgE (transglycosylase-associated protein family)
MPGSPLLQSGRVALILPRAPKLRTDPGSRLGRRRISHDEEHMLHIVWMIIVGFVAGLVARAIVPGIDAMGFWMTTGLGILGSVVGGFISRVFSRPAAGAAFHPAGFVMSIVGAIIVLYAARMMH